MDPGDDEVGDEGIDWTTEARTIALREAWDAKRQKTPRLGLDFGNVIVASEDCNLLHRTGDENPTVDFCEQPCSGAREGVRALVRLFRPENVFIVSKAGRRTAKLSGEWLKESKFAEDTGLFLDEAHIYFVHGRSDKRPVVEALGITHFVDDRMSVLRCLPSCTMRVLLCAPWIDHDDRHDRRDANGKGMQGRVMVQNWPEVVGVVRKWFKNRRAETDATGSTMPAFGTGLAISTSASTLDVPPGVVSPDSATSPTALMSSFLLHPAQCAPAMASYTVAPPVAWGVAERQRQLDSEHEQLRLAYLHLMQGLARAEGDVMRVDALIHASEEENMMLLMRLDMLDQHLSQQAPPMSLSLPGATLTPQHPTIGIALGLLPTQPAAPQLGSLLSLLPESPSHTPPPQMSSILTSHRAPACAPPMYAAPTSAIQTGSEVVPPKTDADSGLSAECGHPPNVPPGAALDTPVGPAPGLPPPGFSPAPSPSLAPARSPGSPPVNQASEVSLDELSLLPNELRDDYVWVGSELAAPIDGGLGPTPTVPSPSGPR